MSKKYKFLSIFLIIILILSSVTPTVYALTGTYNFTSNECSNIQCQDEYLFRNDCFTRSSFLGCSHLETLSAQVAIASTSRYGDDVDKYEVDYSQNAKNIISMLSDMGFEDVTTNKYYKLEKEENSAGVAVAHRAIKDGDKEYTLLAIIPRSAGYKQEWAGNFTVGDGDIHEGFKAARDEVLRYVKKYITDFGIEGNIKVWTAGHSRGAAISNMIGGFFAGGGIEYFEGRVSITPEDVYCYTYATPRPIKNNADKNTELSVSGNRADSNYSNDTPGESYNYTKGGHVELNSEVYHGIRNFISPSDIFPLLPPEAWGFEHYGVDIPANHFVVSEESMTNELKNISDYAYNKYINGGSPNSFERKTFDLKTLSIVKDDGNYSAMDYITFLNERMNWLVYNANDNGTYVNDGYQDTLKSVAGIYGLTMTLFEENMLEDSGSLVSPLLYSYLAYASERLMAENNTITETEAITKALEELLTYYTGEEINDNEYTVDKFIITFAKYISDNENEPVADSVVSGIAGLIPEQYQFILDSFKQFAPSKADGSEITREEGLKAFIKACYYGTDPEAEASAYYTSPEQTRALLYALVSFALYTDHPEIVTVLSDDQGNMNGAGRFKDFIDIVSNIMKTEKDDEGNVTNTYNTMADLADAKLKGAIDTIFEEPLENAGRLYGTKYKNQLLEHLNNVKNHISEVRKIVIYALVYEDGNFSAVSNIKNITTFIGNAAILPPAHYNEVYIAYAKAASNYDCGYDNHDKEYQCVDGDKQQLNITENATLKFNFNIDLEILMREAKIIIDGTEISKNNYTINEDGTIIINEDYTKNLSLGQHTVKVTTDEGTEEVTFYIVNDDTKDNIDNIENNESNKEESNEKSKSNNPSTGDIVEKWICLAVIFGLILVGVSKFKKNNSDNK